MELPCTLGTTRRVPQEEFSRKPYNISLTDQSCSVKMAGYWPRSFCVFMDLDSVSVHKHAKKSQYPAILTSHLVNTEQNSYLAECMSHRNIHTCMAAVPRARIACGPSGHDYWRTLCYRHHRQQAHWSLPNGALWGPFHERSWCAGSNGFSEWISTSIGRTRRASLPCGFSDGSADTRKIKSVLNSKWIHVCERSYTCNYLNCGERLSQSFHIMTILHPVWYIIFFWMFFYNINLIL